MATVNATSNATLNTEDTWIEIFPPAGCSVRIKRVRLSFAQTGTISDVAARLRVLRTSAAGATGTSFTPVEKRVAGAASVSTVNVKNGTTAFSVGTAVANSVMLDVAVNTRGIFEWIARDEDDYMYSDVNQRIVITLRVNVASYLCNVECDWIE